MTRGIYRIRCTYSERWYVGRSENVESRWYEHRYYLNQGLHENLYLQRAWNKYGEESFEFEMVEEVLEGELQSIEQAYLDAFWGTGWLFNMNSKSDGGQEKCLEGCDCKRHFVGNEVREKLRTRNIERGIRPPDPTGRSPSVETRERRRQSMIGKNTKYRGKTYEEIYGDRAEDERSKRTFGRGKRERTASD